MQPSRRALVISTRLDVDKPLLLLSFRAIITSKPHEVSIAFIENHLHATLFVSLSSFSIVTNFQLSFCYS